jgi:hypothetical protein
VEKIMIKKINRLTTLLVTATTFASIVPITSANAATKLETLDGTLKSVQAFDNKYPQNLFRK